VASKFYTALQSWESGSWIFARSRSRSFDWTQMWHHSECLKTGLCIRIWVGSNYNDSCGSGFVIQNEAIKIYHHTGKFRNRTNCLYWIQISGSRELKCLIWMRIEVNPDPQPYLKGQCHKTVAPLH
jgi:hypothetical protein